MCRWTAMHGYKGDIDADSHTHTYIHTHTHTTSFSPPRYAFDNVADVHHFSAGSSMTSPACLPASKGSEIPNPWPQILQVEAKKLADRDPTLKDKEEEEEEEEEEGDGGDDEDEDEQDLGGFEEEGLLPRDVIYREMQADSYPDVGHGCDCLIFCCQGVCLAWGKISAYCLAKYSFLNILTNPCTKVYTSCSKVFRMCCHACIRAAGQSLPYPVSQRDRQRDRHKDVQIDTERERERKKILKMHKHTCMCIRAPFWRCRIWHCLWMGIFLTSLPPYC
jgi:hypothetical protein